MSPLFRQVVTHPIAVIMAFIAGLVFGAVSLQRLAVELMPDISYPTLTVRTAWDGAAPQEVEGQISRPVEEALATLDGLVGLESRSRAGVSDVVLSFDWGTPMPEASRGAREKLQLLFLPDDAERPLLLRYDPSTDPFMRVALSHTAPQADPEGALMALRALAEQEVKRDLEALKGVAAVRLKGGFEREIRVEVREPWLAARRLTLAQVSQAMKAENINLAGGSIVEGDMEYLVRTLNEYTSAEELAELRVTRSDGVAIPLRDVAVVREVPAERQVLSRLAGAEAVELEVFKEADANVVDIADRVKDRLLSKPLPPQLAAMMEPALEDTLPEGVQLRILEDQSAFVALALDNLKSTATLGGLLAVTVLFLFLRDFRATGVIGLSIPVSVVLGFAPLYLTGTSLNLMSLGGLALGVGMLVDNAVVVLESVQRKREEGLPLVDAAVDGTADVAMAVTASTLTTVAVFFPIVFVEGVAGELFGDLAMAVVSSLLASLLVALFLVPTLASLQLTAPAPGREGGLYRALEALVRAGPWGLPLGAVRLVAHHAVGPAREALAQELAQTGWRRAVRLPLALTRFALRLSWALPLYALLVGTGLMSRVAARVARVALGLISRAALGAAGLFQRTWVRVEGGYGVALPWALRHPALVIAAAVLSFSLALWVAPTLGTTLIPEVHQGRFTLETALPVGTPLARTAAVSSLAEAAVGDNPAVASVFATVGAAMDADTQADEGEHTARLRVELVPGADEDLAREQLRTSLLSLEPLQVRVKPPALFSIKTPVEVVLHGWDLDVLKEQGDRVARAMAPIAGLRDVRSSMESGYPEVRIRYDRDRLEHFGLDTATVAEAVRAKVQGVVATELRRGDERLEVRVQLDEGERSSVADLRALNINPRLVPPIPLEAVADLQEAVGPSEIRRVDQQRAVVISANLEGIDLGSTSGELERVLRDLDLPPEISWVVSGQSQEMDRSSSSLQAALALAVFLVYVIMASTFESLLHPLVILASIPLALVGVIGALAVGGTPISVVALIGLIVLAGVVVNNAIVLVDKIRRLRLDGAPIDQAIARAGALRLRPIAITTATTVLGLAPLALGAGAGAEIQQPLALTVIGGLLSSTLLTLVVIPAVYRAVSRG
ncbi:MAG: efflux RND transporter permease subunit [Deltaproteobacteria bacterium]|nr:efflux RND transporter permease subunit [Deltaproteobacteria bacterium]